jgi:hypothetical protein
MEIDFIKLIWVGYKNKSIYHDTFTTSYTVKC